MTFIYNTHGDTFNITKDCYYLSSRYILVNNDKQSERLAELPRKLLDCFIRHNGIKVLYDTIFMEVWGDRHHTPGDVSQILLRLKKYFRAIGVQETELDDVFQTFRGEGLLFSPNIIIDPKPSIDHTLDNIGISAKDFSEFVDCMLYRGISGRMGREGVIALAKKGNCLAALELGELYYHGYVTRNHKPDYKTACEYYAKAGQHPTALWTLGYCMMNNYYPVVDKDKIDYLTARNYFVRAIEAKTRSGVSAAAYTSLGQLWEEGHYPAEDFTASHRCLPADIKQALEYYKLADEQGYHYATNRLGLYYEKRGITIEGKSALKEKAFEYFERSVDLVVDGYALNKLGQYYETGFGCEVNPDKACECYMRAVNEALEDDITGWNLFNAGRVCANRINNQPQWYYDLPRAFDLFSEAMKKLPLKDHGKVLMEMLEILSFDDIAALTPEAVDRKKYEVRYLVHRYLNEAEKNNSVSDSKVISTIKQLVQNI